MSPSHGACRRWPRCLRWRGCSTAPSSRPFMSIVTSPRPPLRSHGTSRGSWATGSRSRPEPRPNLHRSALPPGSRQPALPGQSVPTVPSRRSSCCRFPSLLPGRIPGGRGRAALGVPGVEHPTCTRSSDPDAGASCSRFLLVPLGVSGSEAAQCRRISSAARRDRAPTNWSMSLADRRRDPGSD
jgi:hypothetical protein